MAFSKNLVDTPGSDEWWVKRLAKSLGDRRPRIENLQMWLDGKPPPPWEMTGKQNREAYERLLSIASLNLAELIVSSTLYRVQVEAVSSGTNPTDEEAARIIELMLATDASAQFRQAIEWMLSLSVSYLLVRQVETENGMEGRITAEHPSEVVAEADPLDPAKNVAALKVYRDDARGRDVLVLYRAGYQRIAYKYGTTSIWKNRVSLNGYNWADEFFDSEFAGREDSELDDVPIYTLLNRFGVGEYEKHIPHMQRINHTILQQMIITVMQAFRQRAIKGVPGTDPKTGKQIDYANIFTSDPGSLWILPEAANVWESGQGDINQIISAVTKDVERLAIAAQSPLYALSSDAAQQSAASSELMREGQIFKAEDLQKRLTPRFAAAISHMLKFSGEKDLADRRKMRVIWAPARRSSLLERAQSGQLAASSGLPWQTVAEKFYEFSPAEIEQMKAHRMDDALNAVLNGASALTTSDVSNQTPVQG